MNEESAGKSQPGQEASDDRGETPEEAAGQTEGPPVEVEWKGLLSCLGSLVLIPLVVGLVGIGLTTGMHHAAQTLDMKAGPLVLGLLASLWFLYAATKGFHVQYTLPWGRAALGTLVLVGCGVGILGLWGALVRHEYEGAVMALPGVLGLAWGLFTMQRLLVHAMTDWYTVERSDPGELALRFEHTLRGLRLVSEAPEAIEDEQARAILTEGALVLSVNNELPPTPAAMQQAIEELREGKLSHLLLELSRDGETADFVKLAKASPGA